MLCSDPYMSGAIPLGCGKCVHCRTNRARLWAWRQYLEFLTCGRAAFVTLTYSEKFVPSSGELRPKDVQLFFKRFRKYISPIRVRYFVVGEYGENSLRPHYHISLFGVHWHSGIKDKPLQYWIERAWGKGLVHIGEFNVRTAHYVTGYLTKSIRDREVGRVFSVPEFTRVSLRPGLGSAAIGVLAGSLSGTDEGREGDIPHVVRSDGKKISLGRYLFHGLVRELKVTEEVARNRDDATWEKSWELYNVWRGDETIPSLKAVYLEQVKGRLKQAEARYAIFNQKVGSI